MAGELHIGNDQFQYIARISHGKDSLKMLDVIVSRGLRLDRITTTDIWATDTIRGEHPKMVKFKEIADEFIWQKYHIEVEHLCAMRNRRSHTKSCFTTSRSAETRGGATVGKNRGQSSDFRHCGARGANPTSSEAQPGRPQGFPAQRGSWCKKLKIEYIRLPRLNQPQRSVVRQAQDQIFRKPYHEGRYKNRGVPRHRSG